MAAVRTFSFAEIVQGRDASVRVTDDNMLVAVDLAMVMTGKNKDDAGKLLRRIPEEVFSAVKMTVRTFPGSGNVNLKVVSYQDSIELAMVIPGKIARETRTKFANIIRRYLAGDGSLITEIEANAQSVSPIAQMARASLAAEAPAPNELSVQHKRKLEELEIARLVVEIEGKRAANRAAALANTAMEQEHVAKCKTSYNELCQDTVMDERARMIFKDSFLNMAMLQSAPPAASGGAQALLTDGSVNNKPTSLSLIAAEMGLRIPSNDLISIGGKLKKRYEDKHGKPPTKHDQLCSGRMTKVNSYTEADRPLIEAVLREWRGRA